MNDSFAAEVVLNPLSQQIQRLKVLCKKLQDSKDFKQKHLILDELPDVKNFLKNHAYVADFVIQCPLKIAFAIKAMAAIGQGSIILRLFDAGVPSERFKKTIQNLLAVEQFYDGMGGIVGYHLTFLNLLVDQKSSTDPHIHYYQPEGTDISQPTLNVNQAIKAGIERIEEMGEIYPIGGAGDRLKLTDEKSGELLPAAQLLFCGRTLLEGLIRDLQGREYLHFKLFGKQPVTPIAMMTSHEKDNHQRIQEICAAHHWFGRPQESFKLFAQPLVPVLTKEGNWAVNSDGNLLLKPGGHGVIWKLADDEGVFDWFKKKHQRTKALVRQINNPIAGVDYGLLAFTGIGLEGNKSLGFASCPRLLNTPEGMNVLIEKPIPEGYEYCLTNIEYTEFEKKGVKDVSPELGSPYSVYPANTNILFVDLDAVKKAAGICPIPGKLINMKTTAMCIEPSGEHKEKQIGRLESTMQNIADYMVKITKRPLAAHERTDLPAFLTYNDRKKTISVTKETFKGKNMIGTPEGCFFDLLLNQHDLLTNYCQMQMPRLFSKAQYLTEGPAFIVQFHPGLGPLYAVIAQKIRGGRLETGSELLLEICEVEIDNLHLNGSLLIEAENPLGENANGILHFSPNCGKCVLKNVKVENKGIDRSQTTQYWKNAIIRHEALHLIIHGNGEFYAENIHFKGNHRIEVPDGHKVTAHFKEGKILFHKEAIAKPTWEWKYRFDEHMKIRIQKSP